MTDREKFMAQVISGLCSNGKYVHEAIHSNKGLAKTLVMEAENIAKEFFKESAPSA